ncbi:MAG: hypothetical protein QOI47_237 [Actinomycetota bacterium]|jgi:hypothetical protein|nr:hypothetical protein [Actinomycetota bacterium]
MRSIIRWCQVQWDRALAIALTVVGAIALILGWIGVSAALVPSQQLPFIISGGIGSLFILGIAAALWISADLQDEWRKLDRLEEVLRTPPSAAADDRTDDGDATTPEANGSSSRRPRPRRSTPVSR